MGGRTRKHNDHKDSEYLYSCNSVLETRKLWDTISKDGWAPEFYLVEQESIMK